MVCNSACMEGQQSYYDVRCLSTPSSPRAHTSSLCPATAMFPCISSCHVPIYAHNQNHLDFSSSYTRLHTQPPTSRMHSPLSFLPSGSRSDSLLARPESMRITCHYRHHQQQQNLGTVDRWAERGFRVRSTEKYLSPQTNHHTCRPLA